jgi:hypothetical protein
LRIAFVVVDAGRIFYPDTANSYCGALSPKLRILQHGQSARDWYIF